MKENRVESFFSDIEKFPTLCQSCGMCVALCPVGAITLSQNFTSQFIPHYDQMKCIGCHKCINGCPVRKNNGKKTIIGPYYAIYIGKSNNDKEVKGGSSGGVITALLRYGLKVNIFKEILTVSTRNNPVVAQPIYTKNPKVEQGSKYISSPLCSIYDNSKKKVAITALPCQAKAIRNQNKDAFIFGLFCSKLSLEDLVTYLASKKGLKNTKVSSLSFRKGIWPGSVVIKGENGSEYRGKYNRSQFNAVFNSYNFSNSGCLLCNDYFAEHSDLSFGDPWGQEQYSHDYYGETVIIARTKRGKEFIEEAIKKEIISAQEYPLDKLIKGHLKEIYNKKTALAQRLSSINEKSKAMDSYSKDVLFAEKNFHTLNKYAIRNNWKRREKARRYGALFRYPISLMFITRFAHAFLLAKRLKSSNHLKTYLDFAKEERLSSEK